MSTFQEMGLSPEILRAIEELNFITPTPVQQQTIPVLLESKKDLIALAQTGTGKTAAFGLPILQQIQPETNSIQSLILCPTRELCMQITKDIESFAKYTKNLHVVAVYGGAAIKNQIDALHRGAQIVVATPGRALDLIKRRALKVDNIKWLVLDEADEMLNMGFQEDLDAILSTTPQEKQTLLFSATMPKEIVSITRKYMDSPTEISVGKRNTGADNVKHEYYMVQARDRYEVLKRIADMNPKVYSIVFCRTRMETKDVADKLMQDGYNADALHGDLSQAQRDNVMDRFRRGSLQILVATDVAARGLDVSDLTHVINYNLPDELEVYIHRSGRTGRAGKNGISVSIIHTRESNKIKALEKLTGKKFEQKMVPGGKEICEKQLFNLIDIMEKVEVNHTQIDQFLPAIYKKLEWLDREELIKHFVSVEFNRFLEYYKNARDLNIFDSRNERSDRGDRRGRGRDREERPGKQERAGNSDRPSWPERSDRPERKERKRQSDVNFSRFFINVGEKNGLQPARLIGLINDMTGKKDIEVGKIEIMKKFAFFEIDSDYSKLLFKGSKEAEFDNIPVVVELSQPEPVKRIRDKKDDNYSKGKKKDSGYSKDKKRDKFSGGKSFGSKSSPKKRKKY
jgi:ATP-dependent RNA helicase DeaD